MSPFILGPGAPYELLFDDDQQTGRSLPTEFQAIYGGDWRIPAAGTQPYTFTNFVCSRDGRITFNQPKGASDVSRDLPHDKWLMALLRARADAVLIGPPTLETARKHRWTPAAVFKADADAFAALRDAEGRTSEPLLVILTRTGKLANDAIVLQFPDQPVLIATTERGAEQAQNTLGKREGISYHITSAKDVDLQQLLCDLRTTYGVASLLSEGGAKVYGALLDAGVIDEEFLTVSPIIVGNPSPPEQSRPGLVEGVGFSPEHPPQVELLSVRRVGSFLFQRSRYRRSPE